MNREEIKAIAETFHKTKPRGRPTSQVDQPTYIRTTYTDGRHQQWHEDIRSIAGIISASNPRFQPLAFFRACGAAK